jgi:hypothetical protein
MSLDERGVAAPEPPDTEEEGQDLPDRSHLRAGSSSLIAQDLAINADELTGYTTPELAEIYGVSVSRMHGVLRTARRFLRRKGYVRCVPIREEGYVNVFSQDPKDLALHAGHRIDPIYTEVDGMAEDCRTLNMGGVFDGWKTAMDDVSERLYDIALNGLPTAGDNGG